MPARSKPDLTREAAQWQLGRIHVAGIDEAGRGAWAGPVVAAAVILPADQDVAVQLDGVTDSKRLSAKQRERYFPKIKELATGLGIGLAGEGEIDRVGILVATRLAMSRAIAALPIPPDYLLIDAVNLRAEIPIPQHHFFFADSLSLSVAAASIIAKVTRDEMMIALDSRYPDYGFARHKGYGTAQHRAALQQVGACLAHRQSYQPLRALRQLHLEEKEIS